MPRQGRGHGGEHEELAGDRRHRLGQPAELAKLTVVLMLAQVLVDANASAPKSLLELWKPVLVVGVPWLLIMRSRDLGTGIVFVGIFFAMLFWAGVPWPLLVLLASPVDQPDPRVQRAHLGRVVPAAARARALVQAVPVRRASFVVVANVVDGRRRAAALGASSSRTSRTDCKVFLDPSVDPRGSGYHVIQSQVAIGSGGWFGKGYHARHRRSASRFSPSSTRTSSSRSSARSSASSA